MALGDRGQIEASYFPPALGTELYGRKTQAMPMPKSNPVCSLTKVTEFS